MREKIVGLKIVCLLKLSLLLPARACAMQAEFLHEQESVPAAQEQEQLSNGQAGGQEQNADLAIPEDDQDEFPEQDIVYGDVVINEEDGVTRFIKDIIAGCYQRWDEQRFLAVVRDHIDDGACINKDCYKGRTPLMHACWLNAPLCVIQELLGAGASVRRRDCEGRTVLRYACQSRSPSYDIVKELLDAGARVGAREDGGAMALDYAWCSPTADPRIKDLLLEHYRAELRKAHLIRAIRAELARRDAQESDELPELLEEKEFESSTVLIQRIE